MSLFAPYLHDRASQSLLRGVVGEHGEGHDSNHHAQSDGRECVALWRSQSVRLNEPEDAEDEADETTRARSVRRPDVRKTPSAITSKTSAHTPQSTRMLKVRRSTETDRGLVGTPP